VAAVVDDVRDGYVGVEAARRDYRVAMDAAGTVDEPETERLRAALRRDDTELIAHGEWRQPIPAVEAT
jgi:hypothetical protein